MTVWSTKIYFTQTGAFEIEVPVSDARWETRLTGRGSGSHTIPLFGSGISQADAWEYTRGNRYTITQQWGDYVAFAGVIQDGDYDDRKRTLTVNSMELRGAYFNNRMLYGVPAYNAAGGTATILSVSGTHAVVTADVIDYATSLNSEWNFPLDLPSGGSGSFSASWLYNERLKVEDHLKQIEDDGCEIFLRPYIDGTDLRWAVEVGTSVITYGSETTMDIRGDDSPVLNLKVRRDFIKQMTGVLAFGKGGTSAIARHAPTGGTGASEMGVRDTWVTFSDIDDETRLQAAADHTYNALSVPTVVWSFALHVFPDGPEVAAPGSLLGLVSSGNEFIPDGTHHQRVVALSGGLGTTVVPEVQDAG